jgi:hypothetical protein
MAPEFDWPDGVETDGGGRPLVPIKGLLKQTDFALS